MKIRPLAFPALLLAATIPAAAQVPPATVTVAAGQSIQAAVDAHPAGTRFLIKADVHRHQSIIPKNNNVFIGEPGAVLSGARRLTGAVRQGNLYAFLGQSQEGTVQGECEDDWPRCTRPEDLFIDDRPLRHVATRAEVVPGTWFFDYGADQIVMADDPRGRRVETSVTARAFGGTASGVEIRGLTIEKYATPVGLATVDATAGANWTISRNVVQFNHAAGVVGGIGSRIEYNKLNDNGQHGVGVSAAGDATFTGVVVYANEIARNNFAGVATAWSAGGSKFVNTSGMVVMANCTHHNNGPGLWTDIANVNTLYDGNTVFSNTETGIYHEISGAATIRNNVVANNGSDSPGWVFGAQIMVSTSDNVLVENNAVQVAAGYGHAITVGVQSRPPWTGLNTIIRDNEITYLGAAGATAVATDIVGYGPTLYAATTLNGNAYHAPDTMAAHWSWNDTLMNWTTLRAAGPEATGTLDANVTEIVPDCSSVLP